MIVMTPAERILPPHVQAKLSYATRYGAMTSPFGTTFYVDSGHGSKKDSPDHGRSPNSPFATIDYAIGRCSNSAGDTILLAPGHTETVASAAAISCDVIGITIRGYGNGSLRPTITIGSTANTADISVSAANVALDNLRFICGATTSGDDLADMIDISAASCTIKNCYFADGGANKMPLNCIKLSGTGADRCRILDCEFDLNPADAHAEHAIAIDAAVEGTEIARCSIIGDFSESAIHSASAHLDCRIHHNLIRNAQANDLCIEFTANATGFISWNHLHCSGTLSDTFPLHIGTCQAAENYCSDTDADTSAILKPQATA